ncbi:hypothetical protein [Vibrio harveyi]|uniref:hypothetical protein n=2 Tax=Vibrio harveyi TaxID=669 RepID=UPI000D788900|nr:hypothetical protein [Vibrio harveyi]HDM8059305.1 hypothetical protein [Vibrio harveyi]
MDKSVLVFGTIFAAFMAGAFSFFNLVNSKEQKISEFRQAWIDSFRGEIASLVSAVYFISYYLSNTSEPKAKDIEDSHKAYVSSCAALLTRINAQDPDIATNHVNTVFLERLTDLQTAFNNGHWRHVNILAQHLIDSSKPLLKSEWERVKKGEKGYRRTLLIAALLCVLGLVISVGFLRYFVQGATGS